MPRHDTPERAPYTYISTHASLDEVHLAVHSYDTFQYVVAYNYGSLGNGKVFRCVSHQNCPLRLRMLEVHDEEEEIPVTYRLEVSGTHGTLITNKRRVGIDLALKAEVDALLTAGNHATKCQEILTKKYAGQAPMLAKIPDEKQLHNRRLTLVKNGEIPKSKTRGKRARTRSVEPEPSEEEEQEEEEEEEEEEEVVVDNQRSFTSMLVGGENHRDVEEEQNDDVEVDAEGEDHFDKAKLMNEFAAFPARPVFWSVLKKFKYIDEKNGAVVTQWLTGQVIGWETSEHKPVKWVVRFTDGEKRRLELEELVDLIRASVELGLNVTGRPLDIPTA
ncbi:putative multiple inositol polyphosphate phosphatase [Phytophthora cinnamomi]|uniref:putative multiple inositol polyphosphate phosphatase n=1 Tax=Phytophthora cinnamomi TaxID=4785 RepID=UPI00355A3B22|nr:putative multiple inositol polyphosphate phosphatase [Phytophthora cinnamomi]